MLFTRSMGLKGQPLKKNDWLGGPGIWLENIRFCSVYRGLSFKGHIGKFKHNARIPMKPSRNATDLDKVQMWMKNSFLESDKTDCVAKDDVWMKFKMDMQQEGYKVRRFFFTWLYSLQKPSFSKSYRNEERREGVSLPVFARQIPFSWPKNKDYHLQYSSSWILKRWSLRNGERSYRMHTEWKVQRPSENTNNLVSSPKCYQLTLAQWERKRNQTYMTMCH